MLYIAKLARRLARLRQSSASPMLLALLFSAACSSGEPTGTASDPLGEGEGPIVISPRAVTLERDQQVQFKAYESAVAGSAEVTSIEWTASGGTIGSDGSFSSNVTGDFKIRGRRRGNPHNAPDTSVVIVVPPQPTLTGVSVSPDAPSVTTGSQLQFVASGHLSDGTTAAIGATWTATGGTIDAGGMYTAGNAAGTYRVIGKHATTGLADTVALSLTAPPPALPTLEAVVITPASASVQTGASQQFAVVGWMSDGSVTNVPVTYTATGGTITSTGVYTAGTTAGTYRVIATQTGGTLADTASVTVVAPATPPPAPAPTLAQIILTPSLVSLAAGGMQQFSASGKMSDGSTTAVTATFTATGGTITSGGLYTAGQTAGTFRAIATVGSLADTSSITITTVSSLPVSGIVVSPGQSIQAAVDAAPEGATFVLKAGTHRRQTVTPKNRQTFRCEPGAVLDGEGVTQYAFQRSGSNPDDVSINSTVLGTRGCRITRYAPPLQYGAILAGGANASDGTSGWVVEDVEIDNTTNGGGIRIGHRMTIRRANVHHNYQIGITGIGDDVLIEDSEIAWNNHLKAVNAGWEAGGTKFVLTNRLVVRSTFVHHNWGPGLWTDIGNDATTYEGNRVEDNAEMGIFHEISYAATIKNNVVKRNGLTRNDWVYGAGILISSSGGGGGEITGNTVELNRHGIILIQQNRGSGRLGPYVVQNWNVHHNTVTLQSGFTSGEQALNGAAQDIGSNAIFTTGNNRFESNTYHLRTASSRPFAWANGNRTDAEWRGYGHDDAGTFIR